MAERHRYEYEVDPKALTAGGYVVRMVGDGQRVLELGPGPGAITRVLKEHSGCAVTALEFDDDALALVRPFCEQAYQADLDDASWPSLLRGQDKYPVVVAADVLEHLRDPWRVMRTIKSVLADDGYLVVSLPHAGHSSVVACLLDDDFAYQDYGLLDRTHIRFFGIKNVQRLFEDAGYTIVDAAFVVTRPERTELAARWRQMPSDVRRVLSARRFANVYQIVLKAQQASRGLKGIDLASLPVPRPSSPLPPDAGVRQRFLHEARAQVVSHLSVETRVRLRRALDRLRSRGGSSEPTSDNEM